MSTNDPTSGGAPELADEICSWVPSKRLQETRWVKHPHRTRSWKSQADLVRAEDLSPPEKSLTRINRDIAKLSAVRAESDDAIGAEIERLEALAAALISAPVGVRVGLINDDLDSAILTAERLLGRK